MPHGSTKIVLSHKDPSQKKMQGIRIEASGAESKFLELFWLGIYMLEILYLVQPDP